MPKKRERPPIIPERLASRLWHQREWRLARRTLDGKSLRVLYPGRPNGGPGPDFKDALVQRDDSPVTRGDIEVHRQSAGWSQHGHHQDARYNYVVLHVVLQPDTETTTLRLDGQPVPVAELSLEGDFSAGRPPASSQPSLLPHRKRWRALSPEQLGTLLNRAGMERFLRRSDGILKAMGQEDAEEVMYQSIMEALGYSRNRQPMLELARRLPWHLARQMTLATPQPQQRHVLGCLLLGVAGLGSRIPEYAEEGLLLLGRVGATGAISMEPGSWCFAGVRPANQPHRRLRGATALLAAYLNTGLLEGLLLLVRRRSVAALRDAMTVVVDGVTLIGKDRALDLVVNVILPGLHAWGRLKSDLSLVDTCDTLYRGAPRLAENEITREMEQLLGLQNTAQVKGAMRQQGLHHLYQVILDTSKAPRPASNRGVRDLPSPYTASPAPSVRICFNRSPEGECHVPALLPPEVVREGESPLDRERESSASLRDRPRFLGSC